MTLQQLIYFQEIASTLNFTRAAENLYVSQSSLSHAINVLERELGAPLFVRHSNKKVALTNYGNEFLPYVNSVLHEIDAGQKRIKQLQDPLSGVVRIAYGYINGVPLVSQLFKQYYLDNPDRDISLQFQINNGSKVIENSILNGETDLAFIASPSSGNLNSIQVATQKLMVALPTGHPLATRESLTIHDIKSESILCYHPGGNLFKRINEMFESCGYEPNFSELLRDWTEEITYIAMGKGIGILPNIPVSGEVVLVPLDHPLSCRALYLYWPSDPPLSPAAEYIRQYCLNYFGCES